MSTYLYVCLSIYQPSCQSIYVDIILPACLPDSHSVFFSVCLSVRLAVYLRLSFRLRVFRSVSRPPFLSTTPHSWRKRRDFLPAALTYALPTRLQPGERSPEDKPDLVLRERSVRTHVEKRGRRRRRTLLLTFDLLLVVFTDKLTG